MLNLIVMRNNATSGGCMCTVHAAAGPLDFANSLGFMSDVYKENLEDLGVKFAIFPQQQANKQMQSYNPCVHGQGLLLKV